MDYCKRCPALYYALGVLSGISVFHGFPLPLLLACLSTHPVRFCGYLLLALTSLLRCLFLDTPPLPLAPISGTAIFSVSKIGPRERGGIAYQGILNCFLSEEESYFTIPSYVWIKDERRRPPAHSDFVVKGTLLPSDGGTARLHVEEWKSLSSTISGAEVRFFLKEKMRKFLQSRVKDPLVYAFFVSLATGEKESLLLAEQFSRTGLSHTLALSGFHYTSLMVSLGLLLRLFLSKRSAVLCLIIFISLYFLLIGETPALSRAWIAALIYLLGYLIRRESFGLNALGLALLFSALLDPKAPLQIGYQLTYLATFALFTLYPALEEFLRLLLPKRRLLSVRSMPLLDQHGYILSSLLRESLALNIAVNIATLPLILYYFHTFPLVSFFYNLFFPLTLVFSMAGLLFSFLLFPLSSWILFCNEIYSKIFLDMIFFGSTSLSLQIVVQNLSPYWPAFLTLFFIALGIVLEERYYKQKFAVDF